MVPHASLPRLGRASDDLKWLDFISPELRQIIDGTSTLNGDDNQIGNLENIVARAKKLRLNLPEPFLRFMGDACLQAKVSTCTGCFLALSEDFIPLLEAEGHFLLRFLNDSQSCVMWYLYLNPEGNAGVVASPCFFEPKLFEVMEYEDLKREELSREACLCADTFTEFLYRFWIENSIWYSLHGRLPLTPIQEEYRNQIIQKL
jgi:hypothetical protein